MDRAVEEARPCDVCLAVGSTLSVWPAAGVPVEAIRQGGRLVIVNEGATDLDGMASLISRGPGGHGHGRAGRPRSLAARNSR